MADTNETFRQNVYEKSPDELFSRNRHHPLFVAVRVISPAEGDVIAIECNQPVIGDRDAVCVASEIANNLLWATECRLCIDDPILPEHGSQESRKDLRFGEVLDRPGKFQTFRPKSSTQSFDELSTEYFPEDFHR